MITVLFSLCALGRAVWSTCPVIGGYIMKAVLNLFLVRTVLSSRHMTWSPNGCELHAG
ncbi:hypothetical protein BDU57DRAFT_117621 [Ampelomyces quisqualis]|uniref:Uncharacterized protein n=1 Tax=Ampelomyces quisqualis TaxID=50730 RepID=A0A6A5QUW1_AMPQU|nr:hypothetical protein BDU57DRAFT_117621 [Ampelomyces quisqualis]